MNENELYVVKEYKFDNPLITEEDSIKDSCPEDCHNLCSHNFKYKCIHDIKLKNTTKNEIVNLTLTGKSRGLYDFNKELKVARQRGFIFIQLNKLTIKFYSQLRLLNIS